MTFDELLAEQFYDQSIRTVVIGVLRDMYHSYNQLITKEGTFLPKHLSLLYFVFSRAMTTLIESFQFHSLLNRLFCKYGLIPLEPDWFLPDITSDGAVTWPMAKVMKWIYRQASCSQTQFHFPGKTAESENLSYEHNLENAGNWVRGPTLPSLPTLLSNFSQSFDAQDDRTDLPSDLIESAPLLLMAARLSTSIGQDIEETYGNELLRELSDDCRNFIHEIRPEIQEFKAEMTKANKVAHICEIGEEAWGVGFNQYTNFFMDKKREAHEKLIKLRKASPKHPFKPQEIEALSSKLGNYAVYSNLYPISHAGRWVPDPDFSRLLKKGFMLKNSSDISSVDAVLFKRELAASCVEEQLCWLASWIDAACAYRAGQFAEAMRSFEVAFTQAKYRAGENQYKLVNQYLEACAKNNRKGKFKKGLEWANYLGIQVRWLRDQEQTEENIDFAFYILQKAVYPQL